LWRLVVTTHTCPSACQAPCGTRRSRRIRGVRPRTAITGRRVFAKNVHAETCA
jgi:hypothetical protein